LTERVFCKRYKRADIAHRILILAVAPVSGCRVFAVPIPAINSRRKQELKPPSVAFLLSGPLLRPSLTCVFEPNPTRRFDGS